MDKKALDNFSNQMLDSAINGINEAVATKQKEVDYWKNKAQLTNKQLLKELAQRIVFGSLELEGINFDGLIKIKCPNQNHYVDILDNEWEDKTKPDYTGARTNLTYWLTETQRLKEAPHA